MKKLNQKGFTHIVVLGLAILVVGVVSGVGYKIYNNNKINAKADSYSWTDINSHATYIRIFACKIDLGSSWKLQAKAKNTWTGASTRPFWSIVNADIPSKQILGGYVSSNSIWTNIHYTNISKNSVKTIQAYTGTANAGGADDRYSITSIKSC